jgi:hypothetical protein
MSSPGSANLLLLKQAAGGYAIERSLRFNSADSAYLSRTPASAGNRKTWTWAGWVKSNPVSRILSAGTPTTNYAAFGFQDSKIDCINRTSSVTDFRLVSASVYRDPSAWFHVVFVWNTTSSTASDRAQIWINGLRVTNFTTATYPAQNLDSHFGNNVASYIGSQTLDSGQYFDGYLADIHFIDGQALAPTSFGEFDATTGVWNPKAYTGSYGTNGFRLDFSDNSAATATTLGKDRAGSNNWTPNNLSVTAGAGNDSLVDVPTNGAETDTGVGGEVRGNYCTLNALNKGSSMNLPTNGNLDITNPVSATSKILGTIGVSSSKWYWEATLRVAGNGMPGLAKANTNLSAFVGGDADSWGYYNTGVKYNNNSASSYGSSYGVNDVIGVAFDADNGTLVFYKNGVSQGTAYSGLTSGPYFPAQGDNGSAQWSFNFGQRPFAYTAPSGFKALNTANLPAPTIVKPSTVMDEVLYTGNGAARSITGLEFSPDLVWIKGRSGATDHALYDAVRGVQIDLVSNSTAAETTQTQGLTAFNSDGFSLGTLAKVNTNAATYAAWAWDAGSSTVTNTSGSISSQVRANASAGFSVVTYSTSVNGTVGHGLGVAPDMVIVKRRNATADWPVYHRRFIADGYTNTGVNNLVLSATNYGSGNNYPWNSTAPTSAVFSVGNSAQTVGGTAVAYCFASVASYSQAFSYTGNGLADGPFMALGFLPRMILIKRGGTGTDNWVLLDTKRLGYNVDNEQLAPNTNGAETTTDLLDILSNGFKVRSTDTRVNASAALYVGFAWAESPFQYARAR